MTKMKNTEEIKILGEWVEGTFSCILLESVAPDGVVYGALQMYQNNQRTCFAEGKVWPDVTIMSSDGPMEFADRDLDYYTKAIKQAEFIVGARL